MSKRRPYVEVPDLELGPELDAQIRRMTELADRDVEELRTGSGVRSQLESPTELDSAHHM